MKKRRKKSLKKRLVNSRSRDSLIYVAVAIALGFFAGIVILKFIGQ